MENPSLREHLVTKNCSRHQIFRIAWLYGLNGNNFVKAIRNAAIKKKASGEPLKVVNDQTGTPPVQSRSAVRY